MKILLATDGSSPARDAATLLAGFGWRETDEIRILTVDNTRGYLATSEILRQAQEDLAHTAARVEIMMRQGYADEEILAACREWPADLLVMGAKGSSGFSRFLLGGTTARIIRHATSSVLVARPAKPAVRHVLVGFDDSQSSRAAALSLTSLPLPESAEVELVSVLPPLDPSSPQFHTPTFPSGVTELQVLEDLAIYKGRLIAAGRRASTHTLRGGAAAALLNHAELRGSDLVVLGSHGTSLSERFHRFLLGSVSEKVARYASSHVLIVRQPGE
ncbi:universal stress protein [Geoalkalibacter halelectricus]|uniref:universal stress protein n=1 Tax=Geoalkalibacter halelectricus TaxID=2847045 RepID=UPI003D228F91